jgi:LuxR family maltose regulon positive regulatory protein
MQPGWESTLTILSAPAGFGKTSLLAEWAQRTEPGSVAWLSLDDRDNEEAGFWAYVWAALRTTVPLVGGPPGESTSHESAELERAAATQADLTRLLNEVGDENREIALVLDDYHVIQNRAIHDGVAFLLEHRPPNFHLLMATRADPPLPLAGLRGRGQLVEVRATDLRFTADEAAAYLNDAMELTLGEQDVIALEARTEGWIAALQLAALSMKGRHDVRAFIASFAGDDRYIVDYLAEEVLQRQPEHTRRFLLDTSVLRRLTAALCDELTGQETGKAMLEQLERDNLFVVPLDDRRQWYRYHHLFGDVLRARLMDEDPDRIPALNVRASDWFLAHGEPAEAFEHALAAQDFARAANIVEQEIPALRRGRQDATLRRWLEALPDDLVLSRPLLSIGYVGAVLVHSETRGVQEHLDAAERWLETPEARAQRMHDPLLRSLPALIEMYRSGLARVNGDVPGTIAHAERLLELVDEDDHTERAAAAALLGLSYWSLGDLKQARDRYAESVRCMERAGFIADVLACSITLADLQLALGGLSDAFVTYERSLNQAVASDGTPRGPADMHVGLAGLLVERNDLDGALAHLLTSEALGEAAGMAQNPYRSRVVTAQIRLARGDAHSALQLLDEAERVYNTDYGPDVRPIAAIRARFWIALGRTAEALTWARTRELSVDDELSYVREYEHLTLARVLAARLAPGDDVRELSRFLARLLGAAEEGGRTGSVVDGLLLQALVAQAASDMPAAVQVARRAVALAEPIGYVRLFVDHGPRLVPILRGLLKRTPNDEYVRQLLSALTATDVPLPEQDRLVDPLSERELEVLRLLASDLDGPDIARELVVSVNTMRTHTKNIYAKLGVNSRRAAVQRARELELLSQRSRR